MNKINESVLICGVVKNCGNKINFNVNLAIKTGEIFEDYKIVIYENNSTDHTKQELNKFILNPNIVIKSENINVEEKSDFKLWAYTEITGSSHPCRIEMIANARNKILDEINKDEYNKFTYVIWIDMDSNGWDLNGIVNSFYKKEVWDVVYANNPKHYYDMYAFRGGKFLLGPEIIGEFFWKNLSVIQLDKSENLIPIYSAFGGLGIYKKEIFRKHKFDFMVNEYVQKIYLFLLENNTWDENILNVIQNEDGKFPGGIKEKESGIFWKANSGYNGPVVCEHVTLNFELISNGYKIFINPNMLYFNS